ncbi:MAG: sugar phosphate isomerase/epimerase [Phycisphaerae bacterium]|nr:sugar phosphate isomerase/epimerase [Planctomycetota bacterium]MBL7218902.1 sugar phosphate isomerase/epimerase [Phycisphaerae bacterium]
MERRDILKGSLAAAGIAALGATPVMGDRAIKPPKAKLRICSREGCIPGKTLKEKVDNLQKWGAAAVELNGGNLAGRKKEITDALKGTTIKVGAICGGYSGVLISPDKTERDKAISTLKETLTAAAEWGAAGVIAVPAFNHHKQLVGKEARAALIESLKPIGEHGAKVGVPVMLEPLNRKEAYFLRQLADAASICRDVGNPGAAMMGDFYHMYFEETSDQGAFMSGGKYLRHVHLGSIKRKLPGQDARSFVDGFRGLKRIGYQGCVSLECGCIGKKEVEIPKSFRFLEKQWAEATI